MTQDVESHHLQLLLSYMYRGQVSTSHHHHYCHRFIFIGILYCDFGIIVTAIFWLSWLRLTDRSACWEASSKPSWSWSSSSYWPRLTWKSTNWEVSSRPPLAFRSKDSQTIKAGRWGIIDWDWLMTDDQQQVGKSPEKRARPPSSQTQAGPIRLLSQNEGKLPSMLKSP